MDTAVTIAEAKEQLEELIARARRGEVVTIDDGKGSVRLSTETVAARHSERMTDEGHPLVPLGKSRRLGHLKGQMQVPARLMDPMSEHELRDWFGDDA
jgi:antitoxin (DNA-binding transcriptional repressor) of toxin-antitoxin stability system